MKRLASQNFAVLRMAFRARRNGPQVYRDLSLLSTMQANSTYRIKKPDTQFSCNPGEREQGEPGLHIIVICSCIWDAVACLRQRPNSEKTKYLSGNKINAPKLIL